MDPLGLALENFDAVGRWRTLEPAGAPIDAAGTLPDGTPFAGVDGLRQALLGSDQWRRDVLEDRLREALGQPGLRGRRHQVHLCDQRPSGVLRGERLRYGYCRVTGVAHVQVVVPVVGDRGRSVHVGRRRRLPLGVDPEHARRPGRGPVLGRLAQLLDRGSVRTREPAGHRVHRLQPGVLGDAVGDVVEAEVGGEVREALDLGGPGRPHAGAHCVV